MRVAITSCLIVLAFAANGNAQTTNSQSAPQETLQARNPAYNISSFRDLVQLCSTARDDQNYIPKVSLCAGYISGVLDYHLVDTAWGGGRVNRRVCLPASAPDRLSVLQSLVSWDQTNQKYDDEPAAQGVMRFYMANYPCRRSARGHSQTHG